MASILKVHSVVAQAQQAKSKVHIIGMVHIDGDMQNLSDIVQKLENIYASQGPYTIALELPKSRWCRRIIRKGMSAEEGKASPTEEGSFISTVFWEFSKLSEKGIDVSPIDQKYLLQIGTILQVQLAQSLFLKERGKERYMEMSFAEAEKMTSLNHAARSNIRMERKIIDKRNGIMLNNIYDLLRKEKPIVVMVGAAHAEYIAKKLEEHGLDVEIEMPPRTRALLKIESEGKNACINGAKTEEEKLALAKLVIMDAVMSVYDTSDTLTYIPLISTLSSRSEAEKFFALIKTSLNR